MVAKDVVNMMINQVAEGIGIEYQDPNRVQVYSPFTFRDGDSYSFAFLKDKKTGDWLITDDGDIVTRASYMGEDIFSKRRKKSFDKIAHLYGIRESDGNLVKSVTEDRFAETLFTFTQACFEISRLTQMPADRTQSAEERKNFAGKLENAVKSVVSTARVQDDWHHPEFDQNKIYKIDHYIEEKKRSGVPLLVLGLYSDMDCWKKTASCLHYRQRKFNFKGLGIVDEKHAISASSTAAVEDADVAIFNIDDKKEIEEYILSNAG